MGSNPSHAQYVQDILWLYIDNMKPMLEGAITRSMAALTS